MKEVINSHNRKILNAVKDEKNIQKYCNGRNKSTYLLNRNSLQNSVVNQATLEQKKHKILDNFIGTMGNDNF